MDLDEGTIYDTSLVLYLYFLTVRNVMQIFADVQVGVVNSSSWRIKLNFYV